MGSSVSCGMVEVSGTSTQGGPGQIPCWSYCANIAYLGVILPLSWSTSLKGIHMVAGTVKERQRQC